MASTSLEIRHGLTWRVRLVLEDPCLDTQYGMLPHSHVLDKKPGQFTTTDGNSPYPESGWA